MKSMTLLTATAAVFLTTVARASNMVTVYVPAPLPDVDVHDVANVQPVSAFVSLPYADPATAKEANNSIKITHALNYPTIVLETIAAIVKVECSYKSIAMTFNDTVVFDAASSIWPVLDKFVFITNNNGSCDNIDERGYYVSTEVVCANLTCTAVVSSTAIGDVAAKTIVDFGSVNTGIARRARHHRHTVIRDSHTVSDARTFGPITLFENTDVDVAIDSASISASAIFNGKLSYNWAKFRMDELYFDLDVTFDAAVQVTANVTAAYNDTLAYSPTALSFTIISVPGLLSLGPQLGFSVGADVSASEAVDLTTAASISLDDGSVHLDFVHHDNTKTSGWTPVYNASASLSDGIVAHVNPSASLTVDLGVIFFGGLVDLNSGFTAKVGTNNSFVVAATEGLNSSGVTNLNSTGACTQGLELKSNFTFALDAFVGSLWKDELYNVTLPIVDKCYSWEA